MLCTAQGEFPQPPRAVLQARCTAPSSEHTAMAHEATLRSTRKIGGVRNNHTRPALGASVRDKHCGDGSHTARQSRSERVTANKTHVSDTARCSARQHKACPSKHLPVCFAGLPLGLLETCDQHLGETLFRVPTMVAHAGQKQFVHNWTAQASNANQVLLSTREGLIHLSFRNQQVSLGDTAP